MRLELTTFTLATCASCQEKDVCGNGLRIPPYARAGLMQETGGTASGSVSQLPPELMTFYVKWSGLPQAIRDRIMAAIRAIVDDK